MAKFGFHKSAPLLALLTDFGERDSYVGTMKGVIHSICEEVRIVDLTHKVKNQDVTGAAFVLGSSYKYFPDKTIFVCVVDPGVGGKRDILCMEADRRIFLAPDNGLLSILQAEGKAGTIRTVQNEDLWLTDISTTFHGRDIFAPVAAHLANGIDLHSIGPKRSRIRNLKLPRPVKTAGGTLKGEIIYVDQFGNLITNVGAATLQTNLRGSRENQTISVAGSTIKGISRNYSEVEEGELVALIGSSGYLEIAANKGSAAEKLGCGRGAELTLKG